MRRVAPQPLTEPGVKLPQRFLDENEAEAWSAWFRHVQAGRLGEEDNSLSHQYAAGFTRRGDRLGSNELAGSATGGSVEIRRFD